MGHSTQLLSLIEAIYDAALQHLSWADVIEKISIATGGHSGLLRLVDCHHEAEGFVAAHGYDELELSAYRDHFVHLDPYRSYLAAAPAGTLLASDDVVPLADRYCTEYHNDYERPGDRIHALGSPLGREEDFLLYLGLSRSKKAGPYDESTLDAIRPLLPHLLRAVQIQRLLASAVEARQLSESALDCLSLGVILLDTSGGARFANRSALELARQFHIKITSGGITLSSRRLNDRLNTLVKSVCAPRGLVSPNATGGEIRYPLPGVGILQLRIYPVPTRTELALSRMQVCGIVFLTTPGKSAPTAISLAAQFDLSKAESLLAAHLAEGKTLQEAAEAAAISMATARTHLRAIFRKTGTNRQSDLIRHMLTSLSHLAPYQTPRY